VCANCTHALAGGIVPATGWLLLTKTWHCPQHSREENAGPEVSPPEVSPCHERPCDLRQQLIVPSLQSQDMPLALEAKARIGIGWTNRNTPSAVANQRATREGIDPSILWLGLARAEAQGEQGKCYNQCTRSDPMIQIPAVL
jgi:hypothetical protein